MNVIGIICEYNPFHNGHIYHIKKVKELFPDSIIILCLNGNFTERGEISILKKEDKTKIALFYGVDLVIELPIIFGTQSADTFSYGAITLLNALGIDTLVFGSESNDIKYLKNLAQKQLEDNFILASEKNLSYPTRLSRTLNEFEKIPPNDLLGIAYIKTILKYQYKINCVTIKRTNDYHDTSSNNRIISASNIRNKIKNKINIAPYLPKEAMKNILNIKEDKEFNYLKYRILTDPDLSAYIDVTEGLDYKLKKEILYCNTKQELIKRVISKKYTYNRIQRMLNHILLGITKTNALTKIDYIHILGFNNLGKKYLKLNRKNILLPTKINFKSKVYQYELISALIYDELTNANSYSFERRNKPIYFDEKE